MDSRASWAEARHSLTFRFRGQRIALASFSPRATLLDWLREEAGAKGTKEGCAEGDCGACTVVLSRLRDGALTYEPVNACILLLGQVDGAEVLTVEDLADGGALHPMQQAMVDFHGSQCGFCTPGIVMSLFALYHEREPATYASVCEALAGNLCRCTGYRPIIDAALATCDGAPADRFAAQAAERAAALAALADGRDLFVGEEGAFFAAPASEAALAELYARYPGAVLVGGATDVGLWITKQLRDLKQIIWLGRVAGLDAIEEDRRRPAARRERDASTRATPLLGGAPSRPRRTDAPLRLAPGARERHGRRQHRQRLADRRSRAGADRARRHGSSCARAATTRVLPLEDFFLGYGKQDRGERRIRRARSTRRVSPPTRPIAPSRSPSGSTRTFPP